MARKQVVMAEFFGHGGSEVTSVWQEGHGRDLTTGAAEVEQVRIERATGAKSVMRSLRAAFLPEGYPSSVTPDYLPFQFWDTLQGLSTYIRGMLSTQVLLGGLGVGQSTASVVGATFQWFIRDFTGMLGGILFTLYKGSNLDSNARQWRLAADIINDVGMLLDLISPLVPGAFLPMLCLGSISRAITGTASGATRAALTQHFALRQNAADISAKEGSQETAATMGGMLLGILVARITAQHVAWLWIVFLSLTFFHMYANYRAVRSLCLTSLNPERTAILLHHFVHYDKVLAPHQVAPLERVLPLPRWLDKVQSHGGAQLMEQVLLGARPSNLHLQGGWNELKALTERYAQESYLLTVQGPTIHVVLSRYATSAQVLKAYVHALRLADLQTSKEEVGGRKGKKEVLEAEQVAMEWMHKEYHVFSNQVAQAGWALERVLMAAGNWRADWGSALSKFE